MLSFAVAVKVTTAPFGPVASAVMSLGSERTVGVLSLTIVTVKLFCELLLEKSCAVQLTVVVPAGNTEPYAALFVSARSVAVTVIVTLAPLGPDASFVMSAGTLTVGGVVST